MIPYLVDDTRYEARKTARWLASSGVKWLFHGLTQSGLGTLAAAKYGVGTTAIGWGTEALAWSGFGLGFFINGYRYHKQYEDQQERLLTTYQDEIAAWLGKGKSTLTVEDLSQAAEGVPALQEELDLSRRRRNVNTIAWTATAAIGFALVLYVAFPLLAATGAIGELGAFGMSIVGMGMSFLASRAIERPVGALCHGIAKTKERTGHDYVHELTRMRKEEITPEHVMGVFVASNPAIAERIEEKHGRAYDTMCKAEKKQVLQNFYRADEVYRLAEQLQQGLIRPTELTWKVNGLSSGVEPLPAPPTPRVKRIAESMKKGVDQGVYHTRRLASMARQQGVKSLLREVRANGLDGMPDSGEQELSFVDKVVVKHLGPQALQNTWAEQVSDKPQGEGADSKIR